MIRSAFDSIRTRIDGKEPSVYRALFQLFDGFFYSTPARTLAAPHVRDSNSVQRVMNNFVVATIPCWLIGLWNIGAQTHVAMNWTGMTEVAGWRGALLMDLGLSYDPGDVLACVVHGLSYWLPVFLVALVVGAIWEAIFATRRQRPVDDGLLSIAWLFSLILPPTASLFQVAVGMSFGMVVGKAIYGGTGRYLVSPALLSIAFLVFSYSSLLFAEGAWVPVPGYDEPTVIELAVLEGGVPALIAVDYTWGELFFGFRPGPMGTTSVLGCILGAIFLMVTGTVSWRIILGALLGMIVTVTVLNIVGPDDEPMFAIPWTWHLVMGAFAFGTVFLATDPVAAAMTDPGRWAFGVLVGVLTIVVRLTNPSYYEGILFAIILASVLAPMLDYVVVERNIKRRRRALESTGE